VKIIVDQDEVLAQFVQAILDRWNRENGTSWQRSQVDMWRMETVLGKTRDGRDAEGLIDQWMCEPGFFEDLEPMPDAIWGFNELRKEHDVLVATSIPEVAVNAFDGKRRWMRKHFPDWSMKNFISCSRKGSLQGDVIIDDGAHNIEDWRRCHGSEVALLLDAPWNQHVETSHLVWRAYGWRQLVTLVESRSHFLDLEHKRAEYGVYS